MSDYLAILGIIIAIISPFISIYLNRVFIIRNAYNNCVYYYKNNTAGTNKIEIEAIQSYLSVMLNSYNFYKHNKNVYVSDVVNIRNYISNEIVIYDLKNNFIDFMKKIQTVNYINCVKYYRGLTLDKWKELSIQTQFKKDFPLMDVNDIDYYYDNYKECIKAKLEDEEKIKHIDYLTVQKIIYYEILSNNIKYIITLILLLL